ncbi:MAG: LTA synthase family protein [Bdellovibrionota bacterium]
MLPIGSSLRERRHFVALWLVALSWTSILAFHPRVVTHTLGFLSIYQGRQWRLGKNVTRFGLANTLALGVGELGLQRPVGFSREDSLAAIQPRETATDLVPGAFSVVTPKSLVVILLESFVDPYVYGFKLSADPIPNFRALAKRHELRQVIVPVFGGGTATTSFELLTGIGLTELAAPTHPFLDLIYQPTHSLVWTLRRNGYSTVGLHNFLGKSWRRNKAWPFLGFEKALFLDSMPGAETNYRGFPKSDVPLFNRITKEIESAKGPLFLYGVTVALHAPYFPRERSTDTIRVLAKDGERGLTRRRKAQFEEYLRRIQQMDAELAPLTTLLEKKKIPFVLFGDHHSYLGKLFSKDRTEEELELAKHTTPIVFQRDLAASLSLPKKFDMSCLARGLVTALGVKRAPIDEVVFRDCASKAPPSDLRKNLFYDVFHSKLGFEGSTP